MTLRLQRLLACLLCAGLLLIMVPGAALAARGREPLAAIDLDNAQGADTYRPQFKMRWIQVSRTLPLGGAQTVEMAIYVDEDQMPDAKDKRVYRKNWQNLSGVFTSPEIELQYVKSATVPFRIELWVNGQLDTQIYAYRMLLDLKGNTATTRGIRFRDWDAGITDQWMMFTPLDFDKIGPAEQVEIDIVGSNMYVIGKLQLLRDGDYFILSLQDMDTYWRFTPWDRPEDYDPQAPYDHAIAIKKLRLGLYPSLEDMPGVTYEDLSESRWQLDQWYSITRDLSGRRQWILYLNAMVDYDPNGLERVADTLKSPKTKPLVEILSRMP